MAQYLLLVGQYTDLEGHHYVTRRGEPPTVVESHLDLDRLFVNKFQRVGSDRVTSDAMATEDFLGHDAPVITQHTPNAREESDDPAVVELGAEVTGEFPSAREGNLRVWRRRGRFVITTFDDPRSPIHTQTGWVSKNQVEKCIAEWRAVNATTAVG